MELYGGKSPGAILRGAIPLEPFTTAIYIAGLKVSSNYRLYSRVPNTAQKMKFSIKDFFCKCNQIPLPYNYFL